MSVAVRGVRLRSPAEQVALAVRILEDRHWADVYNRAVQKLGDRAKTLGPLDMALNALKQGVDRTARAYVVIPLVSGLPAELSTFLGDRSASVLVTRYATAEGRPMPSPVVDAQTKALRYRLGCTHSGTLLGWSERAGVAYQDVVTPDCLEVEYLSDDPTEPTVIRHKRSRTLNGKTVNTVDEYDLRDLDAPRFRVLDGKKDITAAVLAEEEGGGSGWPDAWRYDDGTPFHRIVVGGDPRNPYATTGAMETTLNACTYWTHWGAGITDAGHPSRHVRGLRLIGGDTSADPTQSGIDTGPEIIHAWEDSDPEKPGQFYQFGPGFDPEVIGRSVAGYESRAMSSFGLSVDMNQSGGEPTEQERRALEEAIAGTFAECRRVDGEVLRRLAAMVNRVQGTDFPETAYAVLYRDEIAQALADAAKAAEVAAMAQPKPAPQQAAPAPTDDPTDTPADPEEDPE